MDKFHNKKLPHLIYAILWEDDGEEFAFIGKTTTTNTKALLRRHLRGEVTITASYLYHKEWENKPPRLIVLHSLVCTGAEAYRYILCYIRLYEDFDFMTVAYRGTDNQAYDMHPYTKHLYEELQSTVTREFLSTGITIAKPVAEESVVKPKKQPTTQLNMRMDIHTLSTFQQFCRKLRITQREGFVHLMHAADQDNLSTDPLFVEQRETIERQKRRIEELEVKLQSQGRGQKADAKLKSAIANIKQFVTQYIALIIDTPSGQLLKDTSYKAYAELKEYVFLGSAGNTLLELHDLLYSSKKYSAIFIYGKDLVNGTAIKLRYYPKETYVGCSPHSKCFVKNARLFVRYQQAEEDVMELVAALPLPPYEEYECTEQNQPSSDIKPLDEVIREASKHIW